MFIGLEQAFVFSILKEPALTNFVQDISYDLW